jgi:hypothetical protein
MKYLLLIFTLLLIVIFSSCGDGGNRNDDSPSMNDDKQNLNEENEDEGDYSGFVEGMKNLEDMMKKGGSNEAVDFRTLKEFLPEELDNMNRTSATGERTKSFGVDVSMAEGKYESEDQSGRINITITDLGSMKGFAGLAAFAWAFAEIDKETEYGFERTITYSGYKAFEKYNTARNAGSVEIFVGERFMVKYEGYNVSMDEIRSSVGVVNLGELDSMKEEGKKSD